MKREPGFGGDGHPDTQMAVACPTGRSGRDQASLSGMDQAILPLSSPCSVSTHMAIWAHRKYSVSEPGVAGDRDFGLASKSSSLTPSCFCEPEVSMLC